MSGLVRLPEEIDYARTIALDCCHCDAHYPMDGEGSVEHLDDPLRCIECGLSGFIPRQREEIAARFPERLAKRFAVTPHALMEQREALGMTAHDVLVVMALERHRLRAEQLVFPGIKRLGSLTGLSEASVRRSIKRLSGLGLVERLRARKGGEYAQNYYDLDPLWAAVDVAAGLASADQAERRPSDQSESDQRSEGPTKKNQSNENQISMRAGKPASRRARGARATDFGDEPPGSTDLRSRDQAVAKNTAAANTPAQPRAARREAARD